MNYSRAIFLISDDARAVNVTYEAHDGAAKTMYKTFDQNIKVDDYVVVPTDSRHGMTVCKVVDVDVEPDLESTTDMKWIIGVVDRADFEDIKAQEDDAIQKIRVAERKRKRRELRETMIADFDDEIKKLPIYNLENGETEKAD